MVSVPKALVVELAVAQLLATPVMLESIRGSNRLTAMLTVMVRMTRTSMCLSGLEVPK